MLSAPWVANRSEPRVLGFPFLFAWMIASVALTVITMGLVYAFDDAQHDDRRRDTTHG